MGVEQYLFFVVVFLAAGLSNEGRFGLHTYMLGQAIPPSWCHALALCVLKVGSSDKAASKQLIAMGVTDRNILLFLAQIEEQIDYIVQARGGRNQKRKSFCRRP